MCIYVFAQRAGVLICPAGNSVAFVSMSKQVSALYAALGRTSLIIYLFTEHD